MNDYLMEFALLAFLTVLSWPTIVEVMLMVKGNQQDMTARKRLAESRSSCAEAEHK